MTETVKLDKLTWQGYNLSPREEEKKIVNSRDFLNKNRTVPSAPSIFAANRRMYKMPCILLEKDQGLDEVVKLVLQRRRGLDIHGTFMNCPRTWLKETDRVVVNIAGRRAMIFSELHIGDVPTDQQFSYRISFHFKNGDILNSCQFEIISRHDLVSMYYNMSPCYDDGSKTVTVSGYFDSEQPPKVFFGQVEATKVSFESDSKLKAEIPATIENATVPILIHFEHEEPITVGSYTFALSDEVNRGRKRNLSYKQSDFEKRAKLEPLPPIPPLNLDNVDSVTYQAFHGLTSCIEKSLVEQPDLIQIRDDAKYSLLHYAAVGNQIETAKFLLDKGIVIDCVDEDDQTPLHLAVKHHRFDMVKFLLSEGADPNYQNAYGDSPFHYSVTCKSLRYLTFEGYGSEVEIVKLLDSNGGDRTLLNFAEDSVTDLDDRHHLQQIDDVI